MKNKLEKITTILLILLITCSALSCSAGKESGDVLFGKNNFLFLKNAEYYDYESDFRGEIPYSEKDLDKILKALKKRTIAYANNNSIYMTAVIPNAQTVYSENLPSSYGEKGKTRLEQLTDYLSDNNYSYFINLTDTLINAKDNGQLYNNTENSVNALGYYYIYEKIFNSIPQEMRKKNNINATLADHITNSKTEGLSLAVSAKKNVQNNSYKLDLSEDEKYYTLLGTSEVLLSSFIKIGYKSVVPTIPAMLINYNRESELDSFIPYFSSTFGSVGYKKGFEFSINAVNSISPKIAVQLIYEDELYTLLDNDINNSYNAALKPGDDTSVTMTPVVTGYVNTTKDVACIICTVEEGSAVTISGTSFDSYIEYPQDERLIFSVNLSDASETVTITAQVEGKDESSPIEVNVSKKDSSLTVFAGKYSQLHYPDTLADYYCTNLYTEAKLNNIESKLMKKLEKIRKSSGKNTKLLFLIPADAITAYPETATDEMTAKKTSDYSRLQQVTDYFAENDDIIIVNTTSILHENKDKGKLYYQTDTHWNTLGAYFGYYAMMQAIANDGFPAAAPRELDQYKIEKRLEPGGDLASFLGIDTNLVSENKTYCIPNFKNRAVITDYYTGKSYYDYSSQIKCVVDESNLPNAIMITDSFGANLFDFVSDAFGYFVRQTMWEYKTDYSLIEEVKPDYYITVSVERNLANLLYTP